MHEAIESPDYIDPEESLVITLFPKSSEPLGVERSFH